MKERIKLKSLISEEEANPENMKKVLKAVNDKLKEIGLRTQPVTERHADDRWHQLASDSIDLGKVDLLEYAFENMSVACKVAISEFAMSAVIELEYNWEHPSGGRNGHTVRFGYDTNKNKWINR